MNETWTIWVCQCCMLMHANGECCSDDEHGGDSLEPWNLLKEGEHITMGLAEHPDYCLQGRGEDECDCETDTYSTRQCQGCGSWMYGERHAFTLWSK